MSNTEVGGIAVDRLRSLIERIERLNEEKPPLKAIYATSLPKQKAPASMSKLCAKSSNCVSKTLLNGTRMIFFSKLTVKLWIYRRS